MAGASAPLRFLHVEVTCSICLNYYDAPVTVNCGHSFCYDCVESRRVDDREFICPQCGQISNTTYFQVSTQLSNLTEIVKQMSLKANKMGVCDIHGQHLTLYCKEDQAIMCVLCKESKGHKTHTVIPADQAAQECEVQLHKVRDTLKKDRENISKWEYSRNCSINECQDQAKETQKLIQNSFEKVHQFLNEEEKLLLQQLEWESDAKIVKLKEDLDSLCRTKSIVEQMISELEANAPKPAPELLMDIKRLLTRRNNLIEEPRSVPCELQLNYCFPGFLEMLQKYAEPVILDPNTAHFDLTVLDGGKRVKYRDSRAIVDFWGQPGNPERFDICPAVLGTGRFVSGRHYWEMEYEVNNVWEMGVCLDTVIRRSSVESNGSVQRTPPNGFWTVWTEDIYYVGNPPVRDRIGIFLDYEAGEVTFYSVAKRTVVKTFFDTFTGVLRPYFEAHVNREHGQLIVCPVPQRCEGPTISYIFP